jgi:hypothetical protein
MYVKNYLEGHISQLLPVVAGDDDLQLEIISKFTDAVGGMCVLSRFVINKHMFGC